MKHATREGLQPILPLLDRVRQVSRLQERSFGRFYAGAKAFLHFHEDPNGLFADLRGPDDWERFPVTEAAQQDALLDRIAALLPPR
jgi:hypothetical protein